MINYKFISKIVIDFFLGKQMKCNPICNNSNLSPAMNYIFVGGTFIMAVAAAVALTALALFGCSRAMVVTLKIAPGTCLEMAKWSGMATGVGLGISLLSLLIDLALRGCKADVFREKVDLFNPMKN